MIWEKGIDLVKIVYKLTEGFPRKEMFGLTNQMRRAAVSVPSNIAEGQARKHTKEFVQFLHHALGSLAELETQALVAKELDYFGLADKDKVITRAEEIQKMIYGILLKLATYH